MQERWKTQGNRVLGRRDHIDSLWEEPEEEDKAIPKGGRCHTSPDRQADGQPVPHSKNFKLWEIIKRIHRATSLSD